MKSIKEITEYSLVIKKSEFICTLVPCNQETSANAIINQYKEKYPDASHHCVAYIINHQEKANDDGEPSKTAGKPMLNVLEKQGLNNIIAIVTRYYGGIKLGAGGLTRAYTQSVVEALNVATIIDLEPFKLYAITIGYNYTKKFEHLLKIHHIQCIDTSYVEQVTYTCYLPDLSFFTIIQELTNNQYHQEFLKEEYIEVNNSY